MFIYLDSTRLDSAPDTQNNKCRCVLCTHDFRWLARWLAGGLLAFIVVCCWYFLYRFQFDSINHAQNDVEIPNRVCVCVACWKWMNNAFEPIPLIIQMWMRWLMLWLSLIFSWVHVCLRRARWLLLLLFPLCPFYFDFHTENIFNQSTTLFVRTHKLEAMCGTERNKQTSKQRRD